MKRVFLLGLVTGLGLSAASAADPPGKVDPAEWVPADALAYVGVADLDELFTQFKSSIPYRIMQDEQAREVTGEANALGRMLEELRRRVAEALEVPPEGLRNPLAGPLALSVIVPAREGADPAVLLMAGVGDRELMESYYRQARKRLRELSDEYEQVDSAGQTIDVFMRRPSEEEGQSEEDEDQKPDWADRPVPKEDISHFVDDLLGELFSPGAMPPTLAMCLTNSRLLVSTEVEALKNALRQRRAGGSLAETDAYRTLLRRFRPAGLVRFVVNLPRLLEREMGKADDEERREMRALGLDGFREVIGHLRYDQADADGVFEALVLMRGERKGLARLLSMDNRDVGTPPAAPSGTLVYGFVNLNVLEMLDEIERVVRQTDPETAESLRDSLGEIETPDGPLNLRKDLLEHLRGPLTLAMGMEPPVSIAGAHLLVSIGHSNRDAIRRVVERLLGLMTGPAEPRDLRGTPVYVMPFATAVAPAADRILLGTIASVESVLKSSGEEAALTGDGEFRRAAQFASRQAWLMLYVDARRLLQTCIELGRDPQTMQTAAPANPAAAALVAMAKQFVGTVPDGDVDRLRFLLPYQAPIILTVSTVEEGLLIRYVALKPQKS